MCFEDVLTVNYIYNIFLQANALVILYVIESALIAM